MLCYWCNGSGEGLSEFVARCPHCKGSGEDDQGHQDIDTDLLDQIF